MFYFFTTLYSWPSLLKLLEPTVHCVIRNKRRRICSNLTFNTHFQDTGCHQIFWCNRLASIHIFKMYLSYFIHIFTETYPTPFEFSSSFHTWIEQLCVCVLRLSLPHSIQKWTWVGFYVHSPAWKKHHSVLYVHSKTVSRVWNGSTMATEFLLVHMAMNAPFCCNEAFHPPDGNDAPVLRKARAWLHAAVLQGNILFFAECNIIKMSPL